MSGRSGQFVGDEGLLSRCRQQNILFRIAIGAAVLALAGVAQAQSACDAYYPFDGSLTDATGNGYDGLMISQTGGPVAPQFVDGRYGQALHVDGKSAMRAYLDLHYDVCPKFTITAWFQLASVEFDARQYLVSTGARGGIPAIVVNKGTISLLGQGNGLSQKQAIRDGRTWYFIAATFDYDAHAYTLYWRNRAQEGTLREKSYKPEDSFWIGTRSDDMKGTAEDLNIDEVRVYGRVLSVDEIRAVSKNAQPYSRSTAASTTSSPTGTLPVGIESPDIGKPTGSPDLRTGEAGTGRTVGQVHGAIQNPTIGTPDGAPELEPTVDRSVGRVPDELGNPDVSRLPTGAPDPQYDSPEAAEEAARRRAEAQSEGPPPSHGGFPEQHYRVRFSTDVLAFSGVSGGVGDYTEQATDSSGIRFPYWIETRENYDKPCTVYVHDRAIPAGLMGGHGRQFDVCDEGLPRINPLTTLHRELVEPSAGEFGLITGLQVCNNGVNKRVKGIRARVRGLRLSTGTYSPNYTTRVFQERTNCVSWDDMAHCSANTYAVGLRLHFRDGDVVSPRDFLSGLELICTDVQVQRWSPNGAAGSWELLPQGD